MTHQPVAHVKIDGLNHKPTRTAVIRRDNKHADRIFLSMPPLTSLTQAQVIALCDALTDVLEAPQELAQVEGEAA